MDPNGGYPPPEYQPHQQGPQQPYGQPPAQPPNQPTQQFPYGQPPYFPPPSQPQYGQPLAQPQYQQFTPPVGQHNSVIGHLNAFRRQRPVLAGVVGLIVACVVCTMCGGVISAMNGGGSTATTDSTSGSAATIASQATATSAPTATDAPPPTAVPTESPAQYKKSTQSVGVADLAKDPNSYTGKPVTFHAVVLNFARDSAGNPVAANVDGPDFSGPIQIEFTPGLSVKNINENDNITVWGQGAGSFSGTNAYGATIQEGAVYEVYLYDSTTGYSDSSVKDPQAYIATLP